jgi:hypothetical protein
MPPAGNKEQFNFESTAKSHKKVFKPSLIMSHAMVGLGLKLLSHGMKPSPTWGPTWFRAPGDKSRSGLIF